MRNASGHHGENERRREKGEKEHLKNFLHKKCNYDVSGRLRCSRAKQQRKKVCYTCKVVSGFAK